FLDDYNAALKYARQKSMKDFGFDELRLLAAKAGAPEALVIKAAKETVDRFHQIWRAENGALPLTAHMRQVIDAHYQETSLFKGED
ncbi:MAG TPA: kinase, partial [Hyphomonas sp.]|nr:kinase [Hyphomonas sp.]